MKIQEARKAITEKLKEKNLLVRQTEIVHAVNVHERCKTEIEFLKTKQWYIKILDRKEELLEAASHIIWHPEHMKVRYDHWVQNLNWDWCISRQRHFGIPVPVWTCTKCQQHILPELKELPIDPVVDLPSKPCSCGSRSFQGETDVLDTWATSSVTPEIAGNWAHKGEYDFLFQEKEPFSLRPQAHDIIRTWLFYTLVKSMYHHGRVPWKNVMISGHAQDPHGKKMSKSLGNIIEPQEMITKYSADALRFWAAGSSLGDDLPFQEKDLVTGQKFVTKLWNASKFCIMHLEDFNPEQHMRKMEVLDAWLLSKLQKVIKECTESFELYEYSKTKSAVEQFFWHVFCDQYLEIVKDRLYNGSIRGMDSRQSAQYGLYHGLLTILKLTAPIMPHSTEEIYHQLFARHEQKKSIHLASWPIYHEELLNDHTELAGDIGIDIISTVRRYKSEQHVSLKEELQEVVVQSNEPGFAEIIQSIDADLRAVLNAKKISLTGETTLESEKFAVKIGVRK